MFTNYAAVHKFLTIAWKRNALNGDADFDIDEDSKKIQLDIFGLKKMTKIESFQVELRNKLLKMDSVSNKSILLYTYESGHIPKHAEDIIKELKKDGKLHFDGKSPCLTYENVFRNGKIIDYKIIK